MENMSDSQLAFDQERAKAMLAIYRTPAMAARRREAIDALGLQPGESLIDVGTGPGMFSIDAAPSVAPNGRIVGIDVSPDMIAMAEHVRADSPHAELIEFREAHATDLPFVDGTFDVAVSIQVLEYVEDVDGALREINRVLRPGGRCLIWDTDWSGVISAARDEERSERIWRALDEHCQHLHLPRALPAKLRSAGFDLRTAKPHTILDLDGGPESVSAGLLPVIRSFVIGRQGLSEDDLAAWVEEREVMRETGEFFFVMSQFYFVADKPS
jgi:ubiquinone/menaquinone biosynthesis C-methylase UbiE